MDARERERQDQEKQLIYAEGLRALVEAQGPLSRRWWLRALQLPRALAHDQGRRHLHPGRRPARACLHVLMRAGFQCEITDVAWLAKARKVDACIDIIFCSLQRPLSRRQRLVRQRAPRGRARHAGARSSGPRRSSSPSRSSPRATASTAPTSRGSCAPRRTRSTGIAHRAPDGRALAGAAVAAHALPVRLPVGAPPPAAGADRRASCGKLARRDHHRRVRAARLPRADARSQALPGGDRGARRRRPAAAPQPGAAG